MSELPNGWVHTTLDEIGEWRSGGTPSRSRPEYFGPGVPWIKSGDLPDGPILETEEQITQAGLDNSAAKLIPPGSVSLALYGATIGKLGLLRFAAATNQACANVTPDSRLVDASYLFYYLLAQRREFIELGQGGAQPNISQKIVRKHPIPLAPLSEQRRIVAKLDAVLARVRTAQQRLEKVPKILKRFRQSVLDAACSGELTADWRLSNPGLHRNEILGKIREYRRRGPMVEIIPKELVPDDVIPRDWEWVRFGSVIGELRNGISAMPKMHPPGMPILRISAARPGAVNTEDVRFIEDPAGFVPHYCLKNGDLLFTRYNGSLELLGVCGVIRGLGRDLLYPDKLMRVRIDHPFLEPEYVECFFGSIGAHERVVGKAKSSAGQNGVSGTDIKAQPFALPPVEEQREIVRRVAAFFAFADGMEARLKRSAVQVDSLTQSILAMAFGGRLVPTETELSEEVVPSSNPRWNPTARCTMDCR
ncbi:MAG: restriction endonuclease subunit S [Candidatus Solibacter usitatus]|nr:restriction endonuclease subunit S [Candidatus Solibacter usitatus]